MQVCLTPVSYIAPGRRGGLGQVEKGKGLHLKTVAADWQIGWYKNKVEEAEKSKGGCWRMREIDEVGKGGKGNWLKVKKWVRGQGGKRPEVISQPLSEPRCVLAHEMKYTGPNPKCYLLCRASEEQTIWT